MCYLNKESYSQSLHLKNDISSILSLNIEEQTGIDTGKQADENHRLKKKLRLTQKVKFS